MAKQQGMSESVLRSPTETDPKAPPTRRRSWVERMLGPLHIHGVFWYKIHLFAVRHVPPWMFRLLVPAFTALFFLVLRKIRRNIAGNLEVVMGPCGFFERQRRIWCNLYNYSWCLTERYEDLATDRRVEPKFEREDIWREMSGRGTGLVLVTAHIGHWETASAYPADEDQRQIHVVREVEINSDAQELFSDLIEKRGRQSYQVHFARRAGDLGPKLLLALRDGDLVALQGDRPAKDGRTITTTFFGRPFKVPMGPAAMARAAEAPLLPIFVYRTGRSKSHLCFEDPIEVVKTDDRFDDMQRTMDAMTTRVEAAIRRDPLQWFCFVELWPKEARPYHG